MFCSKCGNEIKEGSKFCKQCGNPIENKPKDEMIIENEKYNPPKKEMMDIQKFSKILLNLGSGVVIVSVIWWAYFWYPIVENFNKNLFDVIECIGSSGGKCGIITGLSGLSGGTPYNPILFWFGIVLIVVGVVIHNTFKDKLPTPYPSQTVSENNFALLHIYRTNKFVASLMRYHVYTDEGELCRLKNNSSQIVKIYKEGTIRIIALINTLDRTVKSPPLMLNIIFGESYYIRCVQSGYSQISVYLIEPNVGKREFSSYKLEQ